MATNDFSKLLEGNSLGIVEEVSNTLAKEVPEAMSKWVNTYTDFCKPIGGKCIDPPDNYLFQTILTWGGFNLIVLFLITAFVAGGPMANIELKFERLKSKARWMFPSLFGVFLILTLVLLLPAVSMVYQNYHCCEINKEGDSNVLIASNSLMISLWFFELLLALSYTKSASWGWQLFLTILVVAIHIGILVTLGIAYLPWAFWTFIVYTVLSLIFFIASLYMLKSTKTLNFWSRLMAYSTATDIQNAMRYISTKEIVYTAFGLEYQTDGKSAEDVILTVQPVLRGTGKPAPPALSQSTQYEQKIYYGTEQF